MRRRRVAVSTVISDRNHRPDAGLTGSAGLAGSAGRAGSASHCRKARPRSGNADLSVASKRATRRRLVDVSGRTRTRPAPIARHPRSAASRGARRVLRSSVPSIDCRSGTTDFASTTSTHRDPACHASTSTDPRSPPMANVTSTAQRQPRDSRISTARLTTAACGASSSRSSSSPRHLRRTSNSAPRAHASRSSATIESRPRAPRSRRETTPCDSPHRAAMSACRQPSR